MRVERKSMPVIEKDGKNDNAFPITICPKMKSLFWGFLQSTQIDRVYR